MVTSNSYGTVTKSLSITATSGGASGNVLYTCPNNFDAEVTFLHIVQLFRLVALIRLNLQSQALAAAKMNYLDF